MSLGSSSPAIRLQPRGSPNDGALINLSERGGRVESSNHLLGKTALPPMLRLTQGQVAGIITRWKTGSSPCSQSLSSDWKRILRGDCEVSLRWRTQDSVGWRSAHRPTEGLRDWRHVPSRSCSAQPDDSQDFPDDPHGLPHNPWLPEDSQNPLPDDCRGLADDPLGPPEGSLAFPDDHFGPPEVRMGVRTTRTNRQTTL